MTNPINIATSTPQTHAGPQRREEMNPRTHLLVPGQLHLQAEAIAREVLGNRTILDASEIAAARAEINQRLEALRRPEQREAA